MSIRALTWAIYSITDAIYMMVLFSYFASIFRNRYPTAKVVCVYVLVFCANMVTLYLDNVVLNIAASMVSYAILLSLYHGHLGSRVISALFIYAAAFLADFLIAYATVFLTGISVEQLTTGTPAFLYGLLLSKSLFVILARVLSRIMGKRRQPQLSAMHWVALIVTPTGCMFVLFGFLFSQTYDTISILSSIIVVLISFIVVNVYDKILADYEMHVKNALLEEQVKYYSQQHYLALESGRVMAPSKPQRKSRQGDRGTILACKLLLCILCVIMYTHQLRQE